jgi:hypothetical protein
LKEDILKYDYGIIFLPSEIGIEIVKIFGTTHNTSENNLNFNIADNNIKLFDFFESHVKTDFLKKKNNSNLKISMVSYTRYNSNYLNVPSFRYKSCFNILNKKYKNNNDNLNHFLSKTKSNSVSVKLKSADRSGSICSTLNTTITPGNTNRKFKNTLVTSTNSDLSTSLLFETPLTNSSYLNLNINKCIMQAVKNLEIDIGGSNFKTEKIGLNAMDYNTDNKYFILNNEKLYQNNIFYSEDQSVICEAKGRLCNFIYNQENEDELGT